MSEVRMAAGDEGRTLSRSLVLVLVASLALNFLFIGLGAGGFWSFRSPAPPTATRIIPNLLGYASTLPPERRVALWDLSETERQILRPFRREVRAAREDTIKALATNPFDREAFIAAQARQADTEHRAREAVRDLYTKIASGMTLDERRGFARWRELLRPPGYNLLDEPDQPAQAK